jgi:hypothetical protein
MRMIRSSVPRLMPTRMLPPFDETSVSWPIEQTSCRSGLGTRGGAQPRPVRTRSDAGSRLFSQRSRRRKRPSLAPVSGRFRAGCAQHLYLFE